MGTAEQKPNHSLTGSLLEGEALPQEKLDREAALERKLKRARWERVFMNQDGARVFWEILEECGVFGHSAGGELGVSFTGNSSTFFLEGKRLIGFWLLKELKALGTLRFAQLCQMAMPQEEGDEENE